MTDIVIPLGDGSKWADNELRYALRGIEKHLSNVGKVYLIGCRPDWIQNVHTIAMEDHPDWKYRERNILKKLTIACIHPDVSEDFLYMNDDHFLLKPYHANSFPTYYNGQISETITTLSSSNPYRKTVANTMRRLGDVRNYDVHAPMLINKPQFMKTVVMAEWNLPFGYMLKSLYGYFNERPAEEMKDLKFRLPMSVGDIKHQCKGRKWFSVHDKAIHAGEGMKKFLEETYPDKSKYEL